MKVLVIGCGNIGAQYDLNSDEIKTHVKAWHAIPKVDLTVFDLDIDLKQKIANLYKCQVLNTVDIELLSGFDCVSICTPTKTHNDFLEMAFRGQVKTIICEKPVSLDAIQLDSITKEYQDSNSKVLVNYIRRFQPAFQRLKEFISSIIVDGETLTNVSVTYQRGFINNCSHAFDILEFLFDRQLLISNIHIGNKVFDQFEYDATTSLDGKWGDANISVLGLSNVLFSHFEIDLYFKGHRISIKNGGSLIEFYKATYSSKFLNPLIQVDEMTDCLKDYMKYVVDEAIELTHGSKSLDNFMSSVALNLRMLNY